MTSRLPHGTRAQVIDGWKTPSPLRKIERKGEPNLIDRSKKTTKNPTPIGRVDPNGLGEPNLVDCSKSTTPNGVTTNAPALTPVATGGAPLPSSEEVPEETPAPALSTSQQKHTRVLRGHASPTGGH